MMEPFHEKIQKLASCKIHHYQTSTMQQEGVGKKKVDQGLLSCYWMKMGGTQEGSF